MKWIFLPYLLLLTNASSPPEVMVKLEQKKAVSFIYHRFDDARFPTTSTSSENFEEHLKFLSNNSYNVMTFSEAITYLESDQTGEKVAVITVDDGYKSFYTKALPLLRRYGFTATLFISTETVGAKDFMNWTEIREIQELGIEIGNHSHSHPYFLNSSSSEIYVNLRKELLQSQQLFREHLNHTPLVFAYPYGELDEQMKKIVQEFGFKGAAAQNSGVIHSGSDFFRCPRFPMSDAYGKLDDFRAKAKMKALVPELENPYDFLITPDKLAPELKLQFAAQDLQWNQVQCFVQGGECTLSMDRTMTNKVGLEIRAKAPLTQRRTLYTVTVPDQSGNWHWFSHLWIKPEIK